MLMLLNGKLGKLAKLKNLAKLTISKGYPCMHCPDVLLLAPPLVQSHLQIAKSHLSKSTQDTETCKSHRMQNGKQLRNKLDLAANHATDQAGLEVKANTANVLL